MYDRFKGMKVNCITLRLRFALVLVLSSPLDRNYSYTDNLPPECLPPESIELSNLINDFSNAYEKYRVLLVRLDTFYKT